jgi:carbamoyl-phosphate synthase large subunit
VINSTHGPRAIVDSFNLRRVALQNRIPYYTTLSGARAAIKAIADLQSGKPMDVNSLQDYINAA